MKRLTVLTALIAVLATACGGGSSPDVEEVWARASAGIQDAGATYMTIRGGSGDDALIGVSVNSSIAERAELHETSVMEGDEGSEMMMMNSVGSIAIPAGDEVKLEPGGYHVMLFQLAHPLETGSEFTLTLEFESAGTIEVTVEVRES